MQSLFNYLYYYIHQKFVVFPGEPMIPYTINIYVYIPSGVDVPYVFCSGSLSIWVAMAPEGKKMLFRANQLLALVHLDQQQVSLRFLYLKYPTNLSK